MNYELCINGNIKEFIKKHLNDDVNKLALSKFPEDVDKQFVIRQIQARQVLSKKLPSWAENDELIFPKKLSLEQCSSELTAKYKTSLSTNPHETSRKISEDSCDLADEKKISANSCELADKKRILVDLTGGMGVDTAFLSDNFDKTFYVEMQEELCDIARHNFKILNKNIEVVNDNAEHFLTTCDEVDCIYLDPARRDEYGRKMVSLHDCSPDVAELHDILLKKAKKVLVKVSPMLDIEMIKKELTDITEIHVVAVRNECKEILLEIQKTKNSKTQKLSNSATQQLRILAIDLREDWNFSFTEEEERDAQWTLADNVGKYLYEPGAACMKAGCFKLLSQRFNIDKLHRNSHLYTSDELVADFPGRIFEVVCAVPFDKKTKKEITSICQQTTDNGQQTLEESSKLKAQGSRFKASVAVRNFPLSAEELKKNLGLQDGNDFYIFGTTMKGEKKVVVLTKKI
ncbi:MAG: SAM-dependent methyltransferase [Bacteroidales bacterium]|nr:SAM-dependent methyltransferase [Bacteroidales bacterium]